jgi:hypothetical protein
MQACFLRAWLDVKQLIGLIRAANDFLERRCSLRIDASPSAQGMVLAYTRKENGRRRLHEVSTHGALAAKIAGLMACEYGGEFDSSIAYGQPLYFVPSDTLVSVDFANRLGIRSEQDLFGGVVPRAFIATKTITHALFDEDAHPPEGWSVDFARRTRDVVLPGYSAFSRHDALRAGGQLLKQGAVRLKRPDGIGGLGQTVAHTHTELEEQLGALGSEELGREGIVLEMNLSAIQTFSVGQVRIAGMVASYCGTQDLTHNNQGIEVYGGSRLIVVRGGFDALLRLDLPEAMREAVSQARVYHAAALTSYPGMFASRCNYDVARGEDQHGRIHAGVLEQSWRIGGASGAEIAALEAFQADASLNAVSASTTEIYGKSPQLPADAQVYFQGEDPDVGFLTKYSLLSPYANP